jgi:hypothetical protein
MDGIEFIERPEIAKTFFWKRPSFFQSMTPYDLKARGMDVVGPLSMDALHHHQMRYMQAYMNSVQPFRPDEKSELVSLVKRANKLLRPFPNIFCLPWRFCKLTGGIESGFPHTLSDIIFLPHDFVPGFGNGPQRNSEKNYQKILEVLVHEKVHVYQRKFRIATQMLVHQVWNYSFFDYMHKYMDARNNPDLDGIIYKSAPRAPGFYMGYMANSPPDLANAIIKTTGGDGSNSVKERYEHPYERMAYEISKLVVGQELIDEYTAPLMRWMIDNL